MPAITPCQSKHQKSQYQCDRKYGHIGLHANLIHSIDWFYTEEEIANLPPFFMDVKGTSLQKLWCSKVFFNKWGMLIMDDLEIFQVWIKNIFDRRCPLCEEKILSYRSFGNMGKTSDILLCENSNCLFQFASIGLTKGI